MITLPYIQLLEREPALRLELQLRDRDAGMVEVACVPNNPHEAFDATLEQARSFTQRMLDKACEKDLAESIGLAAMYRRLHESGRISRRVTFHDFLTIAKIAAAWESTDCEIIKESVIEFNSHKS